MSDLESLLFMFCSAMYLIGYISMFFIERAFDKKTNKHIKMIRCLVWPLTIIFILLYLIFYRFVRNKI